MENVFEIATSLSTPLALGGFFAAAFFLTVKQVIAKNIYPKLSQQLGSEIIKLIIDRLFVLSLVAMVLGFAGYVLPKPTVGSANANENAVVNEINHVVIKSTVGEKSGAGKNIRKLLNSKRIQVTGPEKERMTQKASKYNNEVEIFYEQGWNDAERLISIINEELGYNLVPRPDFNNESNVRRGLIIVWLKHGT